MDKDLKKKKKSKGKGKTEEEESTTVFITNLSYKNKEEDLVRKMKRFEIVESCTILKNKETGESTRIAFVLFENADACKAALKG